MGSLKKFQVDPTMLSHQNVPCARLIKQAAGLLRTRFIPHDTRWQAARRGLQLVGLDRFLYIYLLYASAQLLPVHICVRDCARKAKEAVGQWRHRGRRNGRKKRSVGGPLNVLKNYPLKSFSKKNSRSPVQKRVTSHHPFA